MKCPKCNSDLVRQTRHGIEVDYCTNDHGMWLDFNELDELEDEAFNEDDEKGTLIFSSTPTDDHCPKCNALLKQFQYRLYDLTLEFCENKDGFWLTAGEDERVLQLMRQRKKEMKQKFDAEKEWKATIRHLQSPSFFDKLTGLFK
jgi:Zn-finger nucleic acid-binding protein